ncbi:hypothetical protein C1I98_12405 [Spongiactinospora gelatinilytica]|uniref:Uncharacterized protein n=1 Tax=Spongiactinospora gelatinilytica TaxID=2666298 RepID=A0A2W2HA16_9ACTN|nr:helix-turn-helix domain-containing protein [Spongiactinospora gelatinilytica]PZG48845.1 hypothetical protein C1I98_12405 [Spongiactinospora gelatinilytica]
MDGAAPDPGRARTAAQFTELLRQLRAWSGMSYRQLARKAKDAGHVLPHNTLAAALQRDSLPREELLIAFVAACGLPGDQITRWVYTRKDLATLPASDQLRRPGAPPMDAAPQAPARLQRIPPPERATFADATQSRSRAVPGGPSRRRLLATSGADGTVCVWDMVTNTLTAAIDDHAQWAETPLFSPDGRHLATRGIFEEAVRLWDTATMKPAGVLRGHTGDIVWAVFNRDDGTLATSSLDGTARLWDVSTAKPTATYACPARDGSAPLFTTDGRLITVDHSDSRVWMRDPAAGKTFAVFDAMVPHITVSQTGADAFPSVVVRELDGTVRTWDVPPVSAGQPVTVNRNVTFTGPLGRNRSVTLGWNGEVVAIWGGDEAGQAVDTAVWLGDTVSGRPLLPLAGHQGMVRDVVFSPRGDLIATCGDKTARLWRVDHAKRSF